MAGSDEGSVRPAAQQPKSQISESGYLLKHSARLEILQDVSALHPLEFVISHTDSIGVAQDRISVEATQILRWRLARHDAICQKFLSKRIFAKSHLRIVAKMHRSPSAQARVGVSCCQRKENRAMVAYEIPIERG